MASRGVYYLVITLLIVTGIALMVYQHNSFEVPWLPSSKNVAWTAEARISFEPVSSTEEKALDGNSNQSARVSFAIPEAQPGFLITSETTASPDYGFNYVEKQGHSRVEWNKRFVSGPQVLYYRVEFLSAPDATDTLMTVPEISEVVIPEPYLTALTQIKDAAFAKSTDPFSFTREIFAELKNQDQNAKLVLTKYSKASTLIKILNLAGIPAREISVLRLKDGRRNQKLVPFIAVFNEQHEYQIFDPKTETTGDSSQVLIWKNNSESLLDVTGGTNSQVSFSIVRNFLSSERASRLLRDANQIKNQDNIDLSVNALPIEEQAVFKNILLLPIGVLIVVFLRIIVGLKTSGTFMPVLIATAFLQTNLIVGLIGFIAIVGIGLIIRSWLSRLNLLLVARISTVIIAVIGIIGTLSFIMYKVGLADAIKITFFPMIILSWTIERMSILWEEEGYKEVFVQGGGSLLVAIIAYLAMNNINIQHITFNFLGLQLIILALVLLIGNYTGYRLSELKRFKPLSDEISKNQELEADRLKKSIKEMKKEL